MYGLGLKPEHFGPPLWLRLLTFGAACMTAGILIGGAIVIKVTLDNGPPLCSPRVYHMPETIIRQNPDRQYDA